MTPISALRMASPLDNASYTRLSERGGSAGAAGSVQLVQAGALDKAQAQAPPTASVVWLSQAPERAVPADNTYEQLQPFTVTTVPKADTLASAMPKPSGAEKTWASSPAGDAISTLMARNYGTTPRDRDNLANQWRGLGSALLSKLSAATTEPVDFRQTMLVGIDPTQSLDDQFSNLQRKAATVTLQIKTRSGQTVDLQIAVNNQPRLPNASANPGIQVAVSSSGALSDAERQALATLSDGLEEALAGLGQSESPTMDLAGLMNYDRSVFSGLSLDIVNPTASAAVGAFSLRLGEHENTLAFKGTAGQIDLRLDVTPPLSADNAQQRQAALAQQLQLIDAAAERGHADAALVDLFKSSFTQMHQAAAPGERIGEGVLGASSALPGPGFTEQAQPLLSGLTDFEASFSGDFTRNNRWNSVTEKGHVEYEISQKTEVQTDPRKDTASIVQEQSEQLKSQYAKARNEGMLDIPSGNFDRYRIQDRRTVTTLLEAAKDRLTNAVQKTDQTQSHIHETLVNNRVQERRETPDEQHFLKFLQ